MTGYLLSQSGKVSTFEIDENERKRLSQFQKLIGGYIEVAPIVNQTEIGPYIVDFNDVVVLIDEDGRLKGKQPNVVASSLLGYHVLGDAIVVPRKSME